MPAGPFPTKAMHQALKTRVATLEEAPAPGSGIGLTAAPLHIGLPSLGSSTAPTQELWNLNLGWQRRSVVVAGFRLAGSVPAGLVSNVSLQRGPYGNEAVSTLSGAITLARTETVIGGQTFTDYRLSQSYVVTDTTLNINFAQAYAYPVDSQAQHTLEGVINPGGGGFPYLAVLSDRVLEVPTVPAPSDGAFEAGDPLLRRTELVWPASGVPYLHAVNGMTEDGAAADHFHLLLTAGLPQ